MPLLPVWITFNVVGKSFNNPVISSEVTIIDPAISPHPKGRYIFPFAL